MSKYAPSSPAGRVEEALRHLGMTGPLDLAEDALAALDLLEGERADRERRDWSPFEPPVVPTGDVEANQEGTG